MRSTTSYFNSTLYHKTMTRYWPLWAGWTMVLVFMLPLQLLNSYVSQLRFDSAAAVKNMVSDLVNLPANLSAVVIMLAILGVLCAMAVFGYLYNHRSVCMMHALPMRRETLFCTQYLAGLSFLLLPALAVSLLTAILELVLVPTELWRYTFGALGTWLLGYCAIAIFFFSFASFCAMFTGNMVALPVFYAILNALALSVWSLLSSLANRLFYGFHALPGMDVIRWLTPVFALEDAIGYNYNIIVQNGTNLYLPVLDSPAVLAIYAAVGLVLAAASLAVYRTRHLETAGDVVAVPLVRPIFKAGVAFCSGLFLGTFTSIFFNFLGSEKLALSLLVVIWTIIGWFAAEMLLRKSFRVFQRWKGCAAMALVMVLFCSACAFDWFGVETRLPDPEDVTRISVEMDLGSPYDGGHGLYLNQSQDVQTIQHIVQLHQAIVEHRSSAISEGEFHGDLRTSKFHVDYTLKSGSTLSRDYYIYLIPEELDQPGTITQAFQTLLNDRSLAAQAYHFDDVPVEKLLYAQLDPVLPSDAASDAQTQSVRLDLSTQQLQDLWDAVLLDFDEGNIGRRWMFDDQERRDHTYRTDLFFYYSDPDQDNAEQTSAVAEAEYTESSSSVYTFHITLTPQAAHTLAVLEEAGVLDSYSLVSWKD